jgi:histone acetyltransferase (RNA polymerase elongator complex component)
MINKKIAVKMHQAGVETIRLGFETVDSRVQSETGGKITNIEFKKAVNYLLEAGFKPSQIGAYLIPGTKVWGEAKSYFNLEGEVDPLFHNDALLPYLSPDITIKAYQQIKSIAKI